MLSTEKRNAWSALSEWEQLLAISCLFSFVLTLVRCVYTGEWFYFWLNWNLFLALIPFLITRYMMREIRWVEENWRFIIAFMAWLFFIPNTFYIITDLFHLDHRRPVPLWFDTALLFTFVWNGILLGVTSISQMEKLVMLKGYSNVMVFRFMLIGLNAFGVYVGRYLRYNSWDVVAQPLELMRDITWLMIHPLRNRHDWQMISCYALLIGIIYFSFKKAGRALQPIV